MLYKSILIILNAICVCTISYSQDKRVATSNEYDSIKIVLERIYDRDQGIRQIIDSIGYDSPDFQIYLSKMIAIDIENQNILLPILNKFGWLPKSRIGDKASSAIFFVIQHSKLELMDIYFEQFDSLAKIGEANRVYAAMMEDRLLMWKGLKQIYGTQATTSLRANKELVIWPIEDPDKVDSLRFNVGFEQSVLENAKRLGAIYDPNERLPNE